MIYDQTIIENKVIFKTNEKIKTDTNINNIFWNYKKENNMDHWIEKNKEIIKKDDYDTIIKEEY